MKIAHNEDVEYITGLSNVQSRRSLPANPVNDKKLARFDDYGKKYYKLMKEMGTAYEIRDLMSCRVLERTDGNNYRQLRVLAAEFASEMAAITTRSKIFTDIWSEVAGKLKLQEDAHTPASPEQLWMEAKLFEKVWNTVKENAKALGDQVRKNGVARMG